jgi:hypothetical protein
MANSPEPACTLAGKKPRPRSRNASSARKTLGKPSKRFAQFAREGRSSVLPEWAEFYFKWWGIYTQGDGAGVTGGTGGVGKATEYFMMRIGIPNGIATSADARHRHAGQGSRPQSGRHHDPPGHPAALAH